MITSLIYVILIPLCVTILGSWIFVRFQHVKKETSISCEPLSIRQYKEKESNDVSISLSYKNEKVGDSLIVSTIKLTNTGKKDITFNQVFEDSIEIVLKNAKIIDVIVEKQSDKVSAKVEKKGNEGKWFLSWGILKKEEEVVLRIVAVYQKDEDLPGISSLSKDLSFVFRGNNIDKIEFTSPSFIRSLRLSLIVLSILLAFAAFLIPTDVRVLYDVKANGVSYEGVSINYNDFSHEYILNGKGIDKTRVKQMDSINVSKQPYIPSDMIVLEVLIVSYIIFAIVLFVLLKNSGDE